MSVPEPGQDVMASTDRGLQMCTLTGRRILLTCHQGGNASQVAERAATAGQQAKCTCTLQWETGAQQRGLCYRQEFWAAPVLRPASVWAALSGGTCICGMRQLWWHAGAQEEGTDKLEQQ